MVAAEWRIYVSLSIDNVAVFKAKLNACSRSKTLFDGDSAQIWLPLNERAAGFLTRSA